MTDKLIERNPAILWGPPVFAGNRVPVRALMDYLALPSPRYRGARPWNAFSQFFWARTLMRKSDEQREAICARVEYWAQRLHVRPRLVRAQRMTRKWGSCSTSGIVTFATDLVK